MLNHWWSKFSKSFKESNINKLNMLKEKSEREMQCINLKIVKYVFLIDYSTHLKIKMNNSYIRLILLWMFRVNQPWRLILRSTLTVAVCYYVNALHASYIYMSFAYDLLAYFWRPVSFYYTWIYACNKFQSSTTL